MSSGGHPSSPGGGGRIRIQPAAGDRLVLNVVDGTPQRSGRPRARLFKHEECRGAPKWGHDLRSDAPGDEGNGTARPPPQNQASGGFPGQINHPGGAGIDHENTTATKADDELGRRTTRKFGGAGLTTVTTAKRRLLTGPSSGGPGCF